MRARSHAHEESYFVWGVEITDADIIMSDGKSLEHTGVVPDQIRLPTAADIAAQRDPVLVYAASLLGVKITASESLKFSLVK